MPCSRFIYVGDLSKKLKIKDTGIWLSILSHKVYIQYVCHVWYLVLKFWHVKSSQITVQYLSLVAWDKGLLLRTPCKYFPGQYYNASLKVVFKKTSSFPLYGFKLHDWVRSYFDKWWGLSKSLNCKRVELAHWSILYDKIYNNL